MKRIYLVRHGQTKGNLGKFFQFPDTELSEKGHEGGKAVAKRFKNIKVDQIIASHFTRAQQTAQYISDSVTVPVTIVEDFHEKFHKKSIRGMGHSSEEGIAYHEIHEEKFWTKQWSPDGAENFYDILKRIESCIQLLEGSESNDIVVVSHADFIKSFVSYLLLEKNGDPAVNRSVYTSLKKMSNVGVTELLYENGSWSLFHWNDHAHFAE